MPGAFRTFQTHLAGRRDNPGAEGIVIPQNPPPCCAPETPPRPRQLAFNERENPSESDTTSWQKRASASQPAMWANRAPTARGGRARVSAPAVRALPLPRAPAAGLPPLPAPPGRRPGRRHGSVAAKAFGRRLRARLGSEGDWDRLALDEEEQTSRRKEVRTSASTSASPPAGAARAPFLQRLERVLVGLACASAVCIAALLGPLPPPRAHALGLGEAVRRAAEDAGVGRRALTPAALLGGAAPSSSTRSAPAPDLSAEERATVGVFERNTPSVVYITNLRAAQNRYTMDITNVPAGTGSGFVWDEEGHVVTNFHVIKDASDLTVTLSDASVYPATVVGFDPDKDTAVLKVEAPAAELKRKLAPVTVGGSAGLVVGQQVFAIGNPFGLDHTLTAGIISGLGREISSMSGRPIAGVVQTDAAINPGNSGGPLLNRKGELIGVNTAILDPTGRGASSGVGFAIPVDTVKGIVDQIIRYGEVTRPVLGVTLAPDAVGRQLGLREGGVVVLNVPDGSPAAGKILPMRRDGYGRLQVGDVITEMNGRKVVTATDLFRALDDCRGGDSVRIKVLRGLESEETEEVTLGSRVTRFDKGVPFEG